MSGLYDWIASRDQVRVTAPGGLGGQCMDLVNDYLLSVRMVLALRCNAVDLPAHRPGRAGWTANGPLNFPSPGAIVVWGPSVTLRIGEFGHTAIAVLANPGQILSLDQNWPEGNVTHLVTHQYHSVIGWWY